MRTRILFCLVLIVALAGIASAANPRADLNGDGVVNLIDVALFAQHYNSGVYSALIDINGDGAINLADLALFASMF